MQLQFDSLYAWHCVDHSNGMELFANEPKMETKGISSNVLMFNAAPIFNFKSPFQHEWIESVDSITSIVSIHSIMVNVWIPIWFMRQTIVLFLFAPMAPFVPQSNRYSFGSIVFVECNQLHREQARAIWIVFVESIAIAVIWRMCRRQHFAWTIETESEAVTLSFFNCPIRGPLGRNAIFFFLVGELFIICKVHYLCSMECIPFAFATWSNN